MKINWQVEKSDIEKVKTFFRKQKDNTFVEARIKNNLSKKKAPLTKSMIWEQMVICLLTTQQKAGPKSHVVRFLKTKPFPLNLDTCSHQSDLPTFSSRTLRKFGGIRWHVKIGNTMEANRLFLNNGGWHALQDHLEEVRRSPTSITERRAAQFIDDNLKGFGPKQSRNLLQSLGLSRFEVPLDSRTTKWMNSFGFPIKLNAKSLSDSEFYQFVSDGFQQLCKACEIVPCVLDAAIFSSFD